MSHQDFGVKNSGLRNGGVGNGTSGRLNVEYLKLALNWLLAGASWSDVSLRADCTWTPRLLSATALLWAWSDDATLIERFRTARKIGLFLLPGASEPATSYQAFIKLLCKWTVVLVRLIQTALRQRMEQSLPTWWRIDGFVMFGVDGSRVDVPRTISNEVAYAASRKSKMLLSPGPGASGR